MTVYKNTKEVVKILKNVEIRALETTLHTEPDNLLRVSGHIETGAASKLLGRDENRWREIIAPGTFRNAIQKAFEANQDIDLIVDHDVKRILSSTANNSLLLEEDDIGLRFEAVVSDTSWGRDFYALIKDGIIKGVSFGMTVNEDYWNYLEDGTALRTIVDINLFEISVLKTPAYSKTLVEARDFELAEIKVPENKTKKETRALDEELNDEVEVKPEDIMDALNLIAEKIDNVFLKLKEIEEEKDSEDLAEAKRVLEETKNVVDASKKVALEQKAEVEETEVRAEPVVQPDGIAEKQAIADRDNKPQGDPIQPKMPEDTKEELEAKEEEKQEDPILQKDPETVEDQNNDGNEDVEKDPETDEDVDNVEEDKEEAKDVEEDPAEEKTLEEEPTEKVEETDNDDKDDVVEVRSLLEKFKMEVPEIE